MFVINKLDPQIFSTSSVFVQLKNEDYIIIIKWIKMLFLYFLYVLDMGRLSLKVL